MLSTRASDYALRGMVYLARQPVGRLSMASEIASAEDMPEYFFSKIFQNLAKSGLVNSFRGSNGGFALARAPEEIKVLEVIEAIDGPVSASKCATNPDACDRSPACPFHLYWKEAQESVLSVLGKYSLADAVRHIEDGNGQA
jgi:Rrf2 family protein